ncbi:MAG TPA: CotH kinase family protein [Verrucomicrobiae bacterium]|nr:CotH kinase family protein [Verrucomicrobiae bacterium]
MSLRGRVSPRLKRVLQIGCVAGLAAAVLADPGSAGEDPFAAHPVWRIEIELTPQNMDRLRSESRRYVPASFRAFGEVLHNVGVHLKGEGSFRPIDDKPGFTLDFAKYVGDQRLRGLRKIHLNNSVQDTTFLKEHIASELFRAAQVPVPRVAHALVSLNGRELGLYVIKEGSTREFLSRHFENPDGNLYDTDEGHDVDQRMKRHSGTNSTDDQLELERLAAAAREPDLDRRWGRLRESLDPDAFLTFMAMELMICHWDGYCLGQNNFRVYHDPRTGKIAFLPTGMDQVFSKADMPWKPDMSGLVARAVMETPEGRRQYAARFRALFSSLFVSERLTNRVNQVLAGLRPSLKAGMFGEMQRDAAALCVRIAERERSLRKQLGEPDPVFADFHHDVALLRGWKAFDEPVGGKMLDDQRPDSRGVLRIVAGARTSASWRTTVKLKQGRYRFQGRVRVIGATSLPFGNSHGASLRVAGKTQRSPELVDTSDWEELQTGFEVRAAEEEIVLICQLRANSGEAWFDKASLSLVRLGQ